MAVANQPDVPFFRADCHCHTTHSDGTLDTKALLDHAKESQLQGLSITDHDTIDAYDEALAYAKHLNIQLISGIEISAEHRHISVHVLGYAFDLNNPELISFCQRLQQDRESRNQKILERLCALNMPIAMEELRARFGQITLGRPHIAKVMVAKGYVNSMQSAFSRFLGEKARCYVSGFQVDVPEAIQLIQSAGGFAVLAHPHYLQPQRILRELELMPFDGIEAYYGHLSLKQEQPWLELAKKKNWLVTGGSDFHGEKKSFQRLGCAWTPESIFEIFTQRFASHGATKTQ